EVARPSMVVSPIKMNVLYGATYRRRVISVPGVSGDALHPSTNTGTLTNQTNVTYNARVMSCREPVLRVCANMNGVNKPMGSFNFRLKSVPDPVAKFAGKGPADNTVRQADLTAALGVIADLEDFVFDLKFPVRSFNITVIMGGDVKTLESNSNRLTAQQQELLRQVRRNQVVIIENIKATAPDGSI